MVHKSCLLATVLVAIGGMLCICGLMATKTFFVPSQSPSAHSYGPNVVLRGNAQVGSCIAFSPDGALMASASQSDGTIIIWRWPQSVELRRIHADAAGTQRIAFSPNSRVLISAGIGNVIEVWNVDDASRITAFSTQPLRSDEIAISADGEHIYSEEVFGTPRALRCWTIADGSVRTLLEPLDGGLADFVLMPSTRTMILASGQGAEHIDLARPEETLRQFRHPGGAMYLALSSEGILAGCNSYMTPIVKLWDVRTGAEKGIIVGKEDESFSLVSFNPKRPTQLAVVVGQPMVGSSLIRLYDTRSSTELSDCVDAGSETMDMAFSLDGEWLVAMGYDGAVRMWNVTNLNVGGKRG